ncbi:hypothetical protein [Priestia aryabhattai]
MAHDIIFKKAFIRVGESYIPLIQHGVSNRIVKIGNNDAFERFWTIFNFGVSNKLLHTKDEIYKLATRYENIPAQLYKTGKRQFSKKEREFEKWFYYGMHTAKTVEEYVAVNNILIVSLKYDSNPYTAISSKNNKDISITSTEELLMHIKEAEKANNNGIPCTISVKFDHRHINKPKKIKEAVKATEYPYYFVLVTTTGTKKYFVRKRLDVILYDLFKNTKSRCKKFTSEDSAQTYLDQHPELKGEFTVEKVNSPITLF